MESGFDKTKGPAVVKKTRVEGERTRGTGSAGRAAKREEKATEAAKMHKDATGGLGDGSPVEELSPTEGVRGANVGDDDDDFRESRESHATSSPLAPPAASDADTGLLVEEQVDYSNSVESEAKADAAGMLDLDAPNVVATRRVSSTSAKVGDRSNADESLSEGELDAQIAAEEARIADLQRRSEKKSRLAELRQHSAKLQSGLSAASASDAGSEDREKKKRGVDDDDEDDDDDGSSSRSFKSARSTLGTSTLSASASSLQKSEKAAITATVTAMVRKLIEEIEPAMEAYRAGFAPARRLALEAMLLRLDAVVATAAQSGTLTPYAIATNIAVMLKGARVFDASQIETKSELSRAVREALGLGAMTLTLMSEIARVDLTSPIKTQHETFVRLYGVTGASSSYAIAQANAVVIDALSKVEATKFAARQRKHGETEEEYSKYVLTLIKTTDDLIIGNRLLPTSTRVAYAMAAPSATPAAALRPRFAGTCHDCGMRGHMARFCRNKKSEAKPNQKPYMNAPLFVSVRANGARQVDVRALVDTGALPSVASPDLVARLGVEIGTSNIAYVVGVANENSPVIGQCAFDVTIGGATMKIEALVVRQTAFDLLIGTRVLSAIGQFSIEFGADTARVRLNDGRWVRADLSQPNMRVFHVDELKSDLESRIDRAAVVVKAALDREAMNQPIGMPFELPAVGELRPAVAPGPPLSEEESQAFRLIQIGESLKEETKRRIRLLNEEYKELFIDKKGARKTPPIGKDPAMTVKLLIKPGADLTKVRAGPIQMSPEKTAFMADYAEHMLKEGKLTDDVSNCVCSSAAFVVDDDGKGKFRVVANFNSLNNHIFGNAGSPPSMSSLHNFLAEGEFRSTFDLSSCFYQFPLDEASVPLLGVWFGERFLAYTSLPMGLNVSAGFVQSFVSRCLDGENIRFYIDDGGMRHRTEEGIVNDLREFYERCARHGVSLSATKIRIGFVEVPFCGRVIGRRSIAVPDDSMTAISGFGQPRNVKQLRSFLGMINAVSGQVPGVNFVLKPLFAAVAASRAGVALAWSKDMLQAFEEAKRITSRPELLVPLDDSRPLILMTDWSVIGRAIVFAHLSRDGKRFDYVRIITRNHSAAERNHSAARGELDSLRIARKLCPELTEGRLIYWATDSAVARAALVSLRQPTSPLFARILADLQGLQLTVIHVRAQFLALADGLSRDPAFGEDESERRRLKKERVTVVNEESEDILMSADVKSERFRERLLALQLDDVELSVWFEIATSFQENESRGHLWDSPLMERELREERDEVVEQEEEMAAESEVETEEEVSDDELDDESEESDDDATPLYTLNEKRRVTGARVDENGLLWVCVGSQTHFRLAIPKLAVRAIVARLHLGSTNTAHWHARRCLLAARSFLFWQTMNADIVVQIQECAACQRTSQARPAGNLGNAEQRRVPNRFEGFEIDIAEFESKAFLVAVELFSGFTTVMSLPDKTTTSVISALKAGIVQMFGPPVFFQADGGAEFRQRFQQWCLSLLIDFRMGFPRNSTAQARVERANGTLRSCFVRARASGATESAIDLLVSIAFEMNNAPTRENEFISPQLLLFGVPARMALSAAVDIDLSGLQRNAEFASFAGAVDQQIRVHNLLTIEREKMRDERHEASKASFAKRRRAAHAPQPGDLLWAAMRKDILEGSKHDQRLAWFGPYECLSFDETSGRVELRYNGDVGQPFESVVHVRETRPFVEARIELPEAILEREGEFRKEQSQSPIAPAARGFDLVPATVRARLQAAALAAASSRALPGAAVQPIEMDEEDEQAVSLEARAIVAMEKAPEGERATIMMSDGSQRKVVIGDWRFLSPELKKLVSQYRADQREERRKARQNQDQEEQNNEVVGNKIEGDDKQIDEEKE